MTTEHNTHFGFKTVAEADKAKKVGEVFHSVASKYDLMNDVMSAGMHRGWKRFAVEIIGISKGDKVLDIAGGSGDLSKLFAKKVGADGQVVVVSFTDGITFEVVPVFNNTDGSYTYPDSSDGGKWRTTNPRPEIEAIRSRNTTCNGNLVPLCMMMRAWKRKWEVPIGGLLIDTLAYQFIENYTYRDKSYLYYDFMCRDFFKWMVDQGEEQAYWKAPGSGQYVYGKGLFQ